MGSFNACCGISKLPILYGDEVVDFLIGETGSLRDCGFICYPNDLWAPITIQTYGIYDDYGRIVPVDGWHLDYVTKIMRKHVIELEAGDNEYHDIAIKKDELDFDLIQEAMHEGRLYVSSFLHPTLQNQNIKSKNICKTFSAGIPVTRMMVHRFIFDELVSWGFESSRKYGEIITLDILVNDGMKAILDFHKKQKEADNDIRELDRALFELGHHGKPDFDNSFISTIRYTTEGGNLYIPHKLKNYLNYLIEHEHKENHLREIITEISKFIIFDIQMYSLSLLWTPQTGQQQTPYKELSRLYHVCDAHAQKQLKKFEERDDD
jgi:hypothetical protein